MNKPKDLYEILQVHSAAHPDVIQAAFRRLVLLYHPDRNASVDAAEMMTQLNIAYEILRDPGRRADYDRRSARQGQDPMSDVGTDAQAGQTSTESTNRNTYREDEHYDKQERTPSSGSWVGAKLRVSTYIVIIGVALITPMVVLETFDFVGNSDGPQNIGVSTVSRSLVPEPVVPKPAPSSTPRPKATISPALVAPGQACAILPNGAKYSGDIFNKTVSMGAGIQASLSQSGCTVTGELRISSNTLLGSGPLIGIIEHTHLAFTVPAKSNDAGVDLVFSGNLNGSNISGNYVVPSYGQEGDWELSRFVPTNLFVDETRGFSIEPPSGWTRFEVSPTSVWFFERLERGTDGELNLDAPHMSINIEPVQAGTLTSEYSKSKIYEGANQALVHYSLISTTEITIGGRYTATKTTETFQRPSNYNLRKGDEYFFVVDGFGYAIYGESDADIWASSEPEFTQAIQTFTTINSK